eukprot:scaffold109019_cov42-Cyclotella_meneghiniana.AAC.3
MEKINTHVVNIASWIRIDNNGRYREVVRTLYHNCHCHTIMRAVLRSPQKENGIPLCLSHSGVFFSKSLPVY